MDKFSDVVQNGGSAPVSHMVNAMRGWETNVSDSMEKPRGQFGRVVKIQTAGLTLTNELDISFNVPFDDDTEANEASIEIYNLSKKTIGMLKSDNEISITAGYGNDTGVIFTGVISSVRTRWNGQDKLTTITALDSQKLKERDIESISFKAGVKASYILKTLVSKLGLPIAVFKTRYDKTYPEAVTVSGGLMDNIKQYAEACGVSAYINKRKVFVRHLSDGDNLNFTVTTDTGLIGSPEDFTEEVDNEDYTDTITGVTFEMLLEHRITTASIINLKSRDFSGKYRVRSGCHTCTDSEFYTEVTAIDNEYRVEKKAETPAKKSAASSSDTASASTEKSSSSRATVDRDARDKSVRDAYRKRVEQSKNSRSSGAFSGGDGSKIRNGGKA